MADDVDTYVKQIDPQDNSARDDTRNPIIESAAITPEKSLSEHGDANVEDADGNISNLVFEPEAITPQKSQKDIALEDVGNSINLLQNSLVESTAITLEKSLSEHRDIDLEEGNILLQESFIESAVIAPKISLSEPGDVDVGDGNIQNSISESATITPEKSLTERREIFLQESPGEPAALTPEKSLSEHRDINVEDGNIFLQESPGESAALTPEKSLSEHGDIDVEDGIIFLQESPGESAALTPEKSLSEHSGIDLEDDSIFLDESIRESAAMTPEKSLSEHGDIDVEDGNVFLRESPDESATLTPEKSLLEHSGIDLEDDSIFLDESISESATMTPEESLSEHSGMDLEDGNILLQDTFIESAAITPKSCLSELGGVDVEDVDDGKASEISEDKSTVALREELMDRYRLVLAERQELRRKNLFLQKKMVEFFKKRKMDHALKEDPKGLDLESKYLKRLYELQQYKVVVEAAKEKMNGNTEALEKDTSQLRGVVTKKQEAFLERLRKVASTLELKKTNKKISKQAVAGFLSQQSANMGVLSGLRYQDIKMKRILETRKDLVDELDSLGHGVTRAHFEKLKYEKMSDLKEFEAKVDATGKLQEKVRKVVQDLSNNKQREEKIEHKLWRWQQRLDDGKNNLMEIRRRVQNLKHLRDHLHKQSGHLSVEAGLLTRDSLLREFESSLQQAADLWKQLEHVEVEYKSKVARRRGGQVNTPIGFFAKPMGENEDTDEWEQGSSELE